jgi:hypothetical protein
MIRWMHAFEAYTTQRLCAVGPFGVKEYGPVSS